MSGLIDQATSILSQALDGLSSQAIGDLLEPGQHRHARLPGPDGRLRDGPEPGGPGHEIFGLVDRQLPPIPRPGHPPPLACSRTIRASTRPSRRAFPSSGATTSTTEWTSKENENLRNDGNTVDLKTEMTALTDTQIKYSAVSELLTAKFNQLYDVLGGH